MQMRDEQNKNFQRNKSLNNSLKNLSPLDIDQVNKAIELTLFKVSNNKL